MSLRRERKHQTGLSNVDYRYKNDTSALELYEPWKIGKQYGSMSRHGYHWSYTEHNKIFNVSKNINMQTNIVNETPNPKVYQSAQFYKDHNIKWNTKAVYTNERIAQLDESYKGKERFCGDSMMISDINKIRKERKKRKKFHELEHKRKIWMQENIIKDKTMKNKEAVQETQLVNLEVGITWEGKVDIKKLLEIRWALRRRYANRTNFRKIFKEWDQSIGGEISVYDAHNMINQLNIPINYNEARAWWASSNRRGTESLNMQEFMHLIFNDNPALNVDLSKIKFQDEKLYTDGEQVENLKKKMKMNIMEMSKTDELKFWETYLKTKKPMFWAKLSEMGMGDSETWDFDTFCKVIRSFPLPDKYVKDPLWEAIFEQYKSEDNKRMKYKEYLDHCVNKRDKNDFFDFQEKYLGWIQEKIEKNKEGSKKEMDTVLKSQQEKLEWKRIYEKQIKEDNDRKLPYISKEPMGLSHSQPSTEFLKIINNDRLKHFQELNRVEDSFSPLRSLVKNIVGKTRFSANPRGINTALNFQADPKSFLYMSEKDRFNIRGPDVKWITETERNLNQLRKQAILKKISTAVTGVSDYMKMKQKWVEYKDEFGQDKATSLLYKYEEKTEKTMKS